MLGIRGVEASSRVAVGWYLIVWQLGDMTELWKGGGIPVAAAVYFMGSR